MLRLSKTAKLALAAPVLVFALAAPRVARADALPITACDPNAGAGTSCTTAGDGTEDGVCVESTCGSAIHLDDGGFTQTSYPCLLCEIPDAGPSSDAGPTTTDSGPAPEDAGPTKPPSDDAGDTPSTTDAGTVTSSADAGSSNNASSNQLASNSSCAIGAVGARGGGAGALLGLGAVGLAFSIARSRRRRSL